MNDKIQLALQMPDYDFLSTHQALKDNVLYLVVSGSYGYGTYHAGSDIDLRGVCVENPETLFQLGSFEQYEDSKTDTVIYGLKKFAKLALQANPNVLEILGADESSIYKMTKCGQQLRDNAGLFLSKRVIESFGGYAMAQLRRIQNALAHDQYDVPKREKHIADTLNKQLDYFDKMYTHFEKGSIQIALKDAPKPDLYMTIHLEDYPLRDFTSIYANMTNTIKSYEKLTHRNNKKDEIKLFKHAMHLVRLLLTGQFILEGKGIQTKVKENLPLLLDIRHGQYTFEEIFEIVAERERDFYKAAKETELPDTPRQKDVEELMYSIYKKHYQIKID